MYNAARHIAAHVGLGFSPADSRTVKPVPATLLALVPAPGRITLVMKSGNEDVERDTIPAMKRIVRETLNQTKALSQRLKATTLEQTLRNYTDFILNHVRYVKDANGKEQLREPARLIYDGKGDCDCFAITLSSLLTNAKIPHQFKTIKQNGSSNWSHIYVVVPKPSGGYFTLDPVTNQFNVEPSFTKNKTYSMSIERLAGFGLVMEENSRCHTTQPRDLQYYAPTKQVLSADLIPTAVFLEDKNLQFIENGSEVAVRTPTGSIVVPSVITPEIAKEILIHTQPVTKEIPTEALPPAVQTAVAVQKSMDATTVQPTTEVAVQAPVPITPSQAGFGLLAALVIGGIALSAMSDPKKAATKVATGGMAGVKTKKRKYKTLHI